MRKSLFILDGANNLGTGGVYRLKPFMCDDFMASPPAMLRYSVTAAAAPSPVPKESVDVNYYQLVKDIELIVSQVGCSRAEASKALKANGNDLDNAIMSLTG